MYHQIAFTNPPNKPKLAYSSNSKVVRSHPLCPHEKPGSIN